MPVGDIYVDSSFLLKLYLREVESPVVDEALRNTRGRIFVTKLTDVEVISSVRRRLSVADGLLASQTYLGNRTSGLFAELDLDDEVFEFAVGIAQRQAKAFRLKSLDILHLATAVRYKIDVLASFDNDMRTAAAALGLAVLPA